MTRRRDLEVDAEMFGDAWPFTVPGGQLGLVNGNAVVFTPGPDCPDRWADTTFAVNGHAVALGYPGVEPVWRITRVLPDGTELRVSLDEVIATALAA